MPNLYFVCRIFVNRSLHLENIKYYGFDMDYTLAGKHFSFWMQRNVFHDFVLIFFLLQNTNPRSWRHWDSIWWKLVWCTWAIRKGSCNSNMIHRFRCVAYGSIPFTEICWKSMRTETFWFACMGSNFWNSKYSVCVNRCSGALSIIAAFRPLTARRCMKFIRINSCNWTNPECTSWTHCSIYRRHICWRVWSISSRTHPNTQGNCQTIYIER